MFKGSKAALLSCAFCIMEADEPHAELQLRKYGHFLPTKGQLVRLCTDYTNLGTVNIYALY